MRFFHQWPFSEMIQPSVAAVGNFDGMHLGHQAILQQLKKIAAQQKLATTVILFEPQPQEYFLKSDAPARLQRLTDKLIFLKKIGIDQVICLSFDTYIASLSAQQFVEDILLARLVVKCLLVGHDFRFGKDRVGDITLLQSYSSALQLEVIQDVDFQMKRRISSTWIRELLAQGNFSDATQLLGRPYVITGKVIHGAKRGRQLQFPTANIPLLRRKSPLHGVYAVQVIMPSGDKVPGVANIGCRPTIHDGMHWFLEVHLLDSQPWDLYGQRLSVQCIQKIRDEMRFASLDELQSQISKDVGVAKDILECC